MSLNFFPQVYIIIKLEIILDKELVSDVREKISVVASHLLTKTCRDQDSNLGCRGHNAKY